MVLKVGILVKYCAKKILEYINISHGHYEMLGNCAKPSVKSLKGRMLHFSASISAFSF